MLRKDSPGPHQFFLIQPLPPTSTASHVTCHNVFISTPLEITWATHQKYFIHHTVFSKCFYPRILPDTASPPNQQKNEIHHFVLSKCIYNHTTQIKM